MEEQRRIILRNGFLIDPKNGIEQETDIAIQGDSISEVKENLIPEKGDKVVECSGMEIWPGLIDIHLHVSDLFEIHTNTAYGAVQDGVTTALSPGAGNTLMSPALLGAEMDRGLPLNTGVYIGAANVLGTMLSTEELISLFNGKLPLKIKEEKMSLNPIVNRTAQYTVGIKEHMGHFLLPDEKIEQLYEITDKAGLLFLSHTQDAQHTLKLCSMAKGRHLHLAHTNAAGCGTHCDAAWSMRELVEICKRPEFTGEFVTTMLRADMGSLEGLRMMPEARERALQALADGVIDILVSDGQNQSVMKGFGDTRDNIPCILELVQNGILDRKKAVALMTSNPARLLESRTKNKEWGEKFGNAGAGAYANLVVINPKTKHASYVFTNGKLASFEQRYLRSCGKAGNWVSKFNMKKNMGIGDLPIFQSK